MEDPLDSWDEEEPEEEPEAVGTSADAGRDLRSSSFQLNLSRS